MSGKGNVMMIEYSEPYGDLKVDMVALFDARDFTEEKALEMIRSGAHELTNKIVVINKKQYETVFRSMHQIHATWIPASTKANCGMKCSHCGARITNREFVAGNHAFCHKCGAIMDNATEIQEKIKNM